VGGSGGVGGIRRGRAPGSCPSPARRPPQNGPPLCSTPSRGWGLRSVQSVHDGSENNAGFPFKTRSGRGSGCVNAPFEKHRAGPTASTQGPPPGRSGAATGRMPRRSTTKRRPTGNPVGDIRRLYKLRVGRGGPSPPDGPRARRGAGESCRPTPANWLFTAANHGSGQRDLLAGLIGERPAGRSRKSRRRFRGGRGQTARRDSCPPGKPR